VTLSDDSESLLLSVLPEDAEPELLELAELSDFCNWTDFATTKNGKFVKFLYKNQHVHDKINIMRD